MQASSAVVAPKGSLCSIHPDRPALFACVRCGAFICEEDQRIVDARMYCLTCAARDDVDYLEAFRKKHWGKRDSWTWMVGFGTVLSLVAVVGNLIDHDWLSAAIAFVFAAVGILYFLGIRAARWLMLVAPLITAAILLIAIGAAAVVGLVLPAAMATGMFFDTRNRLFFKLPVTRQALQRTWHLYANNQMARSGFMLSLAGLVIPGLCVFGLACSAIGLRRVNPQASPPIGRKGQAIAGVVIGIAGCLLWTSVLVMPLYLRE
jgi:hypothetical protein